MTGTGNITITSIETVEEMPPEDERHPTTLYLKMPSRAARDQCLGAFMESWSALEQAMLQLLAKLMDGDYRTAEVMFYSSVQIRTQTDMITGMFELKRPGRTPEWKKIASKILAKSHNRNQLVHGSWKSEIFVGADEQNRPVVEQAEWVRLYMTRDPTHNRIASMDPTRSPEKKAGANRYTIQRVKRKIGQVAEIREEIEALTAKIV